MQAIELVVILAVFTQVDALGGFARDEVLLMYALSAIAFGLADLLVGQVEELPTWIRTGKFDVLLTRPLSAFLQFVTTDVQLRRMGRVLLSAGVLVAVLVQGGIAVDPARRRAAGRHPAHRRGDHRVDLGRDVRRVVLDRRRPRVGQLLHLRLELHHRLPGHDLRAVAAHAFCFVVPGAFVAYFPTLALLGRPDPLGLPAALHYVTPLVAVAAAGIAALVWRAGVRRYTGTGS